MPGVPHRRGRAGPRQDVHRLGDRGRRAATAAPRGAARRRPSSGPPRRPGGTLSAGAAGRRRSRTDPSAADRVSERGRAGTSAGSTFGLATARGVAACPLLIYALTRIVQLALVAWLLPAGGQDGVRGRLLVWDGGWFVRVAVEGYPHGYTYDETGTLVGNGLAFFPLLPDADPRRALRDRHRAARPPAIDRVLAGRSGRGGAGLHLLGSRAVRRTASGYALVALFCTAADVGRAVDGVLGGAVHGAGRRHAAGRAPATSGWSPALLGLAAALSRPTGAAAAVGARGGRRARRPRRPCAQAGGRSSRPSSRWPACPRTCSGSAHGSATRAPGSTSRRPAGARTFDFGLVNLAFLVVDRSRTGDGWIQVSVALILLVGVVAPRCRD